MARSARTVGTLVMPRNGNNFPTLVVLASATLGDPEASDTDKAGASVVLSLGRGEPLTLAEISCALAVGISVLPKVILRSYLTTARRASTGGSKRRP